MELVENKNIFVEWFLWHFYEMPVFLFGAWKNYILFALNYFSLPVLIFSLFSPWRKYRWVYPKGINIIEFFNTLISNIFSRILGAMMRIVLIAVGILFQIFVIFAGLVVFLAWLLVPVGIIAGFLIAFAY
jgi:hypothetical protein